MQAPPTNLHRCSVVRQSLCLVFVPACGSPPRIFLQVSVKPFHVPFEDDPIRKYLERREKANRRTQQKQNILISSQVSVAIDYSPSYNAAVSFSQFGPAIAVKFILLFVKFFFLHLSLPLLACRRRRRPVYLKKKKKRGRPSRISCSESSR